MSGEVYRHIPELVTLRGVAEKGGRHPTESDLDVIADGAVVVESSSQVIQWVGKTADVPKEYGDWPSTDVRTERGEETWLPAFVECHTHLVYGGHRHHDYALRCCGKTYQEIAAEGGGILSTMEETRNASLTSLVERGKADLQDFEKDGVGVVEIKSGYGLTLESEVKALQAIRELQTQTAMELVPTFLPAHAVPPEFRDRADDYVDTICREWIPEVTRQSLAKYFDVFIEKGFFSVAQAEKLCAAAKEAGLGIKLHTDQFNDIGGTTLGIELGAQSCDHLDNLSFENLRHLARSKTAAVVCPGASLFTGTPYPKARQLIEEGAIVALSTDYNPGTCPSRNLPLMTTLGASAMGMTVPETIAAITWNAAYAVGLEAHCGSLECGKRFQVAKLALPSYEAIPYRFGG